MQIITRQEAVQQGLPRYFLGVPCGNGHISEKLVKRNRCVACKNEANLRYKAKNREVLSQKERKRYHEKKEEICAYWRHKNALNPEKNRARTRKWREENKDRYRDQQRYHQAIRSRSVKQASMGHRFSKEMKAISAKCRAITKRTGEMHHVDHIVPIKGRNVCGLHVPWNTQIIPAYENLTKFNKWETI